MPIDESHIRSANYGPAGYIEAGRQFDKRDLKGLARSYEYLEYALTMLKNSDKQEEILAYTILLKPYLSDPADPGIVDVWRQQLIEWERERRRVREKTPARLSVWEREHPKPRSMEWHDLGIHRLAHYLRFRTLYVVFPKLMSEEEEKKIEDQNAEIYAIYQRLRVSGLDHKASAEHTGGLYSLSLDAVERIIEFRSTLHIDKCSVVGCDRAPYQQNKCQKHYMREYRDKNKNTS